MIILLRTDKPEAELCLYNGNALVDSIVWEAHRQLAETIHSKVKELLERNGLGWTDITGIGCFKGPGSFTGLRIGATVGNALASSLGVPIVAEGGTDWQISAIHRLINGDNEHISIPDYGRAARITLQKK